jgi:hypothetical protein
VNSTSRGTSSTSLIATNSAYTTTDTTLYVKSTVINIRLALPEADSAQDHTATDQLLKSKEKYTGLAYYGQIVMGDLE